MFLQVDKNGPIVISSKDAEQGQIPVQTGFDRRVAELLAEAIESWRDRKDQVPVQLLKALCQLSISHDDQAANGFTALELYDEMRTLRPQWVPGPETDKEEISRKIRKAWKDLDKIWSEKREGVHQLIGDQGLMMLPELGRDEGGGTGYMTRYLIRCVIPQEKAEKRVTPDQVNPNGKEFWEIRYICEDVRNPGHLARLFAVGFAISGWRKAALLTLGVAAVVAVILLTTWASIALPAASGVGMAIAVIGFPALIAAVLWRSFGPLFQVSEVRILRAPWWLQSVDGDQLLEWRMPPRYTEKAIYLVRYTSACSICHGQVSVVSGSPEYRHRLVGRCVEAPRAHVFSFDHVGRVGRGLPN